MDLNADKLIDWAYSAAVLGDNGEAIEELVQDYITQNNEIEDQVNSFINWQCAKIGAGSFASGLGGIITLPIAVPSSVALNLYINVRLVAGIAYLGGHDVKNDNVKTVVLATLVGSSVQEVLKSVGANIASKGSKQLLSKVSSTTLRDINKIVGCRLLSKAGSTSLINLSKFIPIISGIVSSGIDIYLTKKIAQIAKGIFIKEEKITSELFEIEKNYIGVCINLLKVDTKLESEEIIALSTLIDEVLIDSVSREQMKFQLNSEDLLPINFELIKSDEQLSENLINRLQELSMIDGKITTAELKYISEVINKINS
ncbi:hypothetical protein SKC35_10135 [Aquirufa sp. KTFRIE-69F]|uniref:EcsC family protein n=1 Tax=Aquirufa originis TaxID=3096514 RepID=A0ABW6D765_9BACT